MIKFKILIVEDEFLIALELKKSLSQSGYAVCGPVASGQEAVESARTESPDMVLMDIRLMGDMDGIEAARQIGTFSSASIIFATGYPDPDLKARAMALKPAAYLIKPVEISDIEAAIQSAHKAKAAK